MSVRKAFTIAAATGALIGSALGMVMAKTDKPTNVTSVGTNITATTTPVPASLYQNINKK
jgi:hypothetical protein